MLKPQIGLVVLASLAERKHWWLAVIAAGLLSLVAALPQFYSFGIAQTLREMAYNLAMHGKLAPNQPENLIGIAQLASLLGVDLVLAPLILVASLLAFVHARIMQVSGSPMGRALHIIGLSTIILLIVPLHDYDCVLAAPIFIAVLTVPLHQRFWFAAGLLLAVRAGNLATFAMRFVGAPVGLASRAELALLAVSALLCAIGVLMSLPRLSRKEREA